MVYDVKRENFRRKAWLVAGGHMMDAPTLITFASVVPCESMRIALTLAALNGLQVKTADIENAYLQAPVAETIWCKLGSEFGSDAGKPAIIVRSLYGLKSAGASFLKSSRGLYATYRMAILYGRSRSLGVTRGETGRQP